MNPELIAARVEALLPGRSVTRLAPLQQLWSGYGAILRAELSGPGPQTVIVKAVEPPTAANHPRGWNSDRSHARKLRSYEVERRWYLDYAAECGAACRVAELVTESSADGAWLFILEDLDAAGFSARRREASDAEVRACLAWLASLHATFLGRAPRRLWPTGTYWHLDTRPDELEATADQRLREAAPRLDARLNAARHHTLVHGDAKIANFCFPPQAGPVSAVDFQYVGGGCGMKDVAYFFSSCLDDHQLQAQASAYLDSYFTELRAQLHARFSPSELDDLESEWRHLYPIAWADFVRFLAGWSPGHWKLGKYSEQMTDAALVGL